MKILVVSDTHGDKKNLEYLLKHYGKEIDVLIHCGDYIKDVSKVEEAYPDIEVHAVLGNCDLKGYLQPAMKCIEKEGVKILITHGHKHHVKYDYEELIIDAKAHDARIVLFGHTHIACEIEEQGIVVFNPGSLFVPRDIATPSFGVIEVDRGNIRNMAIYTINAKYKIQKHPHFV